ncbi:hypothetical protein VQ03_25430 [Methylobacterium tarhaniae]|uniref:Uncharacterized protein n=1 Tax=Methylobacterium tarhaniae TaxID=1187852 RepID=A0A0J6SHQ8_9HYPH|nr:hypothetical protein [Methylobacterium tarhaniae]KMO33189.1 hypothetical protein VQ03_25430 [Methylobacterium tarhaniae]
MMICALILASAGFVLSFVARWHVLGVVLLAVTVGVAVVEIATAVSKIEPQPIFLRLLVGVVAPQVGYGIGVIVRTATLGLTSRTKKPSSVKADERLHGSQQI